ncbi:MAG TPA: hypothetical protein VF597_00870 [Candidatus Saccharimonadales bacterium]|jgi:hypothetical protein
MYTQVKKLSIAAMAIAVAAAPVVASAASSTANTTINATVNSVISVSSVSPVTLNLTPTSGGVVSSSSDTVSVSTNNTAGYTLTLADNDTTVNLVSGGNTITAHAGTTTTPTALTNGKWGFAKAGAPFDVSYTTETNAGSSATKWAGVPPSTTPFTLKTTATTASSDPTVVWYAAKVDSTQPNGTYSDTVVYTATTN